MFQNNQFNQKKEELLNPSSKKFTREQKLQMFQDALPDKQKLINFYKTCEPQYSETLISQLVEQDLKRHVQSQPEWFIENNLEFIRTFEMLLLKFQKTGYLPTEPQFKQQQQMESEESTSKVTEIQN